MSRIAAILSIILVLAGSAALVWLRPSRPVARLPVASRPTSTIPVVYRTDPRLEPDTCVAAWLLTRIVSPGAKVVVAAECPGSIPFDVPGCPLSRQPGKSASRVVAERCSIRDPFALALVQVAQELEITPWTVNSDPFFMRVRGGLGEILNTAASEQACLDKAIQLIDGLQHDGLVTERAVTSRRAAP